MPIKTPLTYNLSSFWTEMEVPLIDFEKLDGEKRSETMALLHQACEKGGFFQVTRIEQNFSNINGVLMQTLTSFVFADWEPWSWQRLDGQSQALGKSALWGEYEGKLLWVRNSQRIGEEKHYLLRRLGKLLFHLPSSEFQRQWDSKPLRWSLVSSSKISPVQLLARNIQII